MIAAPCRVLIAIGVVAAFPRLDAHGQIQNVHIEVDGGPAGKGVAISRGVDCFVLTAAHVVSDPLPIRVIGAGRRSSSGRKQWSDRGADVAVIAIEEPESICFSDFFIKISDLDVRLERNRFGYLRVRNEYGGEDDIWVRVTRRRDGSIDIEPREPYQALVEGLSGSMLYVEDQPTGILLKVSTEGLGTGRVYPINRIVPLVSHFLPLVEPREERDRFDEVLAAEAVRKNVAYMKTTEFCRNLLAMAKWIAKPEDFTYAAKRRSSLGGYEYDMDSWLFPDKMSVLTVSQDQRDRSAKTRVGFVPQSMDLDGQWDLAERAIESCIRSDIRKQFDLRQRGGQLHGNVGRDTRWNLERTGFLGISLNQVDIWLELGYGEMQIRVWSIN